VSITKLPRGLPRRVTSTPGFPAGRHLVYRPVSLEFPSLLGPERYNSGSRRSLAEGSRTLVREDGVDQRPSAEDRREQAEHLAAVLGSYSGEKLDFSLDSLGRLDAVLASWADLDEAYGEAHIIDALMLPIAAYVGEVLCRAGARWHDAGPASIAIVLPDGRAVDLSEAVLTNLRGARLSFAGLAGLVGSHPAR
jgi:hypothetical protein